MEDRELKRQVQDLENNITFQGHFILTRQSIQIALLSEKSAYNFYGKYIDTTLPSNLNHLIKTTEQLFDQITSVDKQSLQLSNNGDLTITFSIDQSIYLYKLPLIGIGSTAIQNKMKGKDNTLTLTIPDYRFMQQLEYQKHQYKRNVHAQMVQKQKEIKQYQRIFEQIKKQKSFLLELCVQINKELTSLKKQRCILAQRNMQKGQKIINLKQTLAVYQHLVFGNVGAETNSLYPPSIDHLMALQKLIVDQIQQPDPLLAGGPENVTIPILQYYHLKIQASTNESIYTSLQQQYNQSCVESIKAQKYTHQLLIQVQQMKEELQVKKKLIKKISSLIYKQ